MREADSDTNRRPRIQTSVQRITDKAVSLLPELRDQRAIAELVVDDMCRRGLLFGNQSGIVTYLTDEDTQVLKLGQEFLEFISEPQEMNP